MKSPRLATQHRLRRALVFVTLLAAVSTPLLGQSGSALAEAARKARDGDTEGAIALLEARSGANEAESSLLASLYLQTGRAQEAWTLLEPMAATESASPNLLVDAGRAAVRIGEPESAMALFRRALEADAHSPAAKELGMLFGAMGDYSNSYPLLLNWVRRHPDDGTAVLLAALAAVELERPMEAGQLLESLDDRDPRVRLLAGKALVLRGDGESAIEMLRPLMETVHPDQVAEVRHSLVDAYLLADRATDAIDVIEGNVGDDIRLAIKLSEAFEQAGYDASAASALKRFVEPLASRIEELPDELKVNATDMALRYGRATLAAGQAEEGARYLEIAARLDPQSHEAWQQLALARTAVGDEAGAAQARATASELAPIDLPTPSEDVLAVLDDTGRKVREASLLSRTDPQAALAALQAEARIVPADPRPPLAAARILLNQSRLVEAERMVDFALSLVPARQGEAARQDELWRQLRVRSLSLKARVSASQNRLDEAKAMLREVLELEPNHPDAQQRLDRLNAAG